MTKNAYYILTKPDTFCYNEVMWNWFIWYRDNGRPPFWLKLLMAIIGLFVMLPVAAVIVLFVWFFGGWTWGLLVGGFILYVIWMLIKPVDW